VIEHVADHRHATRHPLPGTTQFAMVKLRHRAFAVQEGLQQRSFIFCKPWSVRRGKELFLRGGKI
jgi:hypothetical protein